MNENAVTRVEPATITPPAQITPMHMLQVAIEKGADLDRLQQLMDLQERWEANEARKAFVAAMAAFKADPPTVLKSKEVSFGGKSGTAYRHATLDQVCAAIVPALSKVGISHRWEVAQDGNWVTVTCVLTHLQGHSERVAMTAPNDASGSKNAIQSVSSAVTYLERYTLLAATGIAAADTDDDGRGTAPPATITEEQAADLRAMAEEVDADIGQFCAWLRVERLSDLPASQYRKALAGLEAKRRKA